MGATSKVSLPEAQSRDIGGETDGENGTAGQEQIYDENVEANQEQGTGMNKHLQINTHVALVKFVQMQTHGLFYPFEGGIDQNGNASETSDDVYTEPNYDGYATPYKNLQQAPTTPTVSECGIIKKKWCIIFIILLISVGGIVVGLSVHFTQNKSATTTTAMTTTTISMSTTKTVVTTTSITTTMTTTTINNQRKKEAVFLLRILNDVNQNDFGLRDVQMVIGPNGQFNFNNKSI